MDNLAVSIIIFLVGIAGFVGSGIVIYSALRDRQKRKAGNITNAKKH